MYSWHSFIQTLKRNKRNFGIIKHLLDRASPNIRFVVHYRLQGRFEKRFGRLAGWLGPWEDVQKDHSVDRPVETVPETDENNSLQVERQVTL